MFLPTLVCFLAGCLGTRLALLLLMLPMMLAYILKATHMPMSPGQSGATVDAIDTTEQTALFRACESNRLDIIDVLLAGETES